jgi:DNA polymerase Pol2
MVDVYVVDVMYDGKMLDGVYTGVVRIFGRRSTGESVVVRVRGVPAYFYCLAPAACPPSVAAETLAKQLTAHLRESARALALKGGWAVRRAEKLEAVGEVCVEAVRRTPVMHYQQECDVLRISYTHPCATPELRAAILEGKVDGPPAHVFESTLDPALRFMVDTGVRCSAWIHIAAPEVDDSEWTECTSAGIVCASPAEITVYTDAQEKERGLVPRLTAMSFDIECYAELGAFPDPTVDSNAVIQIACDVIVLDGRPNADVERTATAVLFALGETDAAVVGGGVDVRCFSDEAAMLTAFAKFVRCEADPDFITSWNGPNFDWKYIVSRCEHLGIVEAGTRFSRVPYYKTRNNEAAKSTKAFGSTKDNEVSIPGRVVFDLLLPIRKNYKLRSYKLDDVAYKYLGERKTGVKHTDISRLWRGTAADRGKLGHYCVQDARLPRRLMLNRHLWPQYSEMARCCRLPTTYLVTKGEQIKVFTLLHHAAREKGYIVDTAENNRAAAAAGRDAKYQGATVIEPERGFYPAPVATLDFASLYPTIMMRWNLCYTTHVPKERVAGFAPEDITITPTGDAFVKPHVRRGLLPGILESLGAERTVAKDLMAAAAEAGDKAFEVVYDKRQLAIKVTMNSVYGFTGVTVGRLPLQAIARSVTAYGRDMIFATKDEVERVGPPGTRVIYGDTDSVMILYPCTVPRAGDGKLTDVKAAIAESRDHALAAAVAVNKLFAQPIKIVYEKIFFPYLLVSKKRYAGGYFTSPADARQYVMKKGIESERRDNAVFVPRTLDDILTCLMDDMSPERAIATAVQAVQAVVDGPSTAEHIIAQVAAAVCRDGGDLREQLAAELTQSYQAGLDKAKTIHDMKKEWCGIAAAKAPGGAEAVVSTLRSHFTRDDYVMSKSFSRPADKFDNVQPHIEVVKNMALRTDDIAAGYRKYLGDRIDYIIIAPTLARPETFDEYAPVLSKNPEKLKGCVPIGFEEELIDGKVVRTGTIMGRKKRFARSADRSEEPEWAAANGLVPDAVYYIEKQLVGPIARLLRALVGSKEAAIRRVLEPVAKIVRPQRGYYPTRFDADIKRILGLNTKRSLTPAAQERKEGLAWDKAHEGQPPVKRARASGPLDAFFKSAKSQT